MEDGTRPACQVFCVRNHLFVLALFLPACVDAPITAAHMAPDGQLRGAEQWSFAAHAEGVERAAVQVAAVLAVQADGPLEDAAVFSSEAGAVHLHLRADRLLAPRSVIYVWTHENEHDESRGVLTPTPTLTLAASHPISSDERGTWTVEVVGIDDAGNPGEVLLRREFQVL